MDRKAIAAIALCAAFLIFYRPLLHLAGLDRYLEAPRPAPASVQSTARDSLLPPPSAAAPEHTIPDTESWRAGSAPDTASIPSIEQTFAVETPLYRAVFSDHGARLLAVEIKHYASAHGVSSIDGRPPHVRHGELVPTGDRVVLGASPLLALDLGAPGAERPLAGLTYAVSESLDASGQKRVLTFTGTDPSGLQVRQTYRVNPDNYSLGLEVELHGVPAAWRVADYSLTARSWPTITEADTLADARALRATSLVGTNLRREVIGGLLKGPKRFDGSALWAGVQSRYFICAAVVETGSSRGVVSQAQRLGISAASPGVVSNSLVMAIPAESSPVHRFTIYVGPSEYFRLSAVGHEFQRAVDMGWNWVLPFSRALLQLLKWLYGVLHNYGLAILAIATLVRLVLHPLNMMSMKSMRSMQKLQPELERIRQKYKDNPTEMNTAVMALYKENKVNPAGGCLPMLLQMPLFIALYQVLFNAIELRQAPFVAWISDLSAPDHLFSVAGFPVRLLPIIMLGSGLLAQLVTPSDPRQKPTMYMMNVVMLVFFYNLPSGLVLYWTIMNVLTALQQWMILRQDDPQPVTVAAPVVEPRRSKGRKPARS
jgi:YidC/Oxa1 family membrane protein insertase